MSFPWWNDDSLEFGLMNLKSIERDVANEKFKEYKQMNIKQLLVEIAKNTYNISMQR